MMTATQSQQSTADDAFCVHCGHSGSDVRMKSCPNRCSYHARCLDLAVIRRQCRTVSTSDTTSCRCPCCSSPSLRLEMLPLSFAEIDQAQRMSRYDRGDNGADFAIRAPPGKRMHVELSTDRGAAPDCSSFYDPASPRTGKWSDEEVAFRDEMVPHFVEGSLPLSDGLKLIEFLSNTLKSKPSRLTKKMKHAKLSTRHFHLDSGFIRSDERARELSRLEQSFVNSISDPVERSEIKFHMRREWRDHLAERLTLLGIEFDGKEWLRSVDAMDRRIALAKSRNRMVKRRFMMGKAMEKDTSSPTPGIFIDQTNSRGDVDDVDLELLASTLEADNAEDVHTGALHSGTVARGAVSVTEVSVDNTGKISGHSTALPRSSPEPSNVATSNAASFRSTAQPSTKSDEEPNFRFAAPFLAKIVAYIENNRVPFEHVDIWAPSVSDPVLDPTGATAPEPSLLGSGSSKGLGVKDRERLCFAGSASVGVQILCDDRNSDLLALPLDHRSRPGFKAVPLSSDEIYHLSLFGSYSEKFSFSSGCGLPGRVFESAVPAWEQYIANAPSHLFERRGGAMQFGIKTALGLPIRSPNVGRVVLVLYSRHNREKDDELVAQIVRDFCTLNPCPRWKLMVDMGKAPSSNNPTAEKVQHLSPSGVTGTVTRPGAPLTAEMLVSSEKKAQISNLISLLGENMPSDQSTPLGQQLHNIMTLRLVLLRTDRSFQDEQLVDSMLTLFESYVQARRSRPDITLMLARDFAFHSKIQRQQQLPMVPNHGLHFERQTSMPTIQHLSIGAMSTPPQQQEKVLQVDHAHHRQQSSSRSSCPKTV